MEFRLLGPFEASEHGEPLDLGGRKQRALLARLLLDAGRPVPVDRLIADVWGEESPASASKLVQVYVSKLRKCLPDGVLVTRPPGYAAAVARTQLDVACFERLHEEGRAALDGGDAATAAAKLGEALSLWRGTPLAEFQDEPFAGAESARLEERRVVCVEDRIAAELQLGRHARLAGELEALVAAHPLRERLREQQMLALYRAGRQAEALGAYQEHRRTLDAELGIAPSSELQGLERRILRHDPSLVVPAPQAAQTAEGRPTEVRYTRSGDVSIAYQVVGGGPIDIVLVHGWVCSFHPGWEWPGIARFYRRLAELGRLILFDKRGTGLSDRVQGIAHLEERIDDLRAVLDAVGSERAVLIGVSEGGPMVSLFAAAHPERTAAIVAIGTYARRLAAADYPIDVPSLEIVPEEWGVPLTRRWMTERVPSLARDEAAIEWYASWFQRSASPGAAQAVRRMNDAIDVRDVLPAIRVPALVLYREREWLGAATQYMGERIPGGRVVALPGDEHVPWEGDTDRLMDEIQGFLGGTPVGAEPELVLTTVLHLDGVEPGAAVEPHLAAFRGRRAAGPAGAAVATFDGPARAIRSAQAITAAVPSARAGLHTGECAFTGNRVEGPPVTVAAAVASTAEPGEVRCTSTVRDLVAGSGLRFEERGLLSTEPGEGPREIQLYTAVPEVRKGSDP